jgi:hypothetical protein
MAIAAIQSRRPRPASRPLSPVPLTTPSVHHARITDHVAADTATATGPGQHTDRDGQHGNGNGRGAGAGEQARAYADDTHYKKTSERARLQRLWQRQPGSTVGSKPAPEQPEGQSANP